jgi:hypothetical protein
MASIVQETDNGIGTTGQSSIAAGSLTFTAGNLIAAFVKFEETSSTATISGFTAATKQVNSAGTSWGQWFYQLSASGGSLNVTANFSPSTDYPSIFVYEVSGTGTWAFDAESTANGSSTALNSGNMSVAGSDGIALGGYAEYTLATVSSAQINGVAADRTDTCVNTFSVAWAKTHSSGFTGAATATLSSAETWAVCGIAFKLTSAGTGTSRAIPTLRTPTVYVF